MRIGPTLPVEIGFDPSFRAVAGPRPSLPPHRFPALVDTGAIESCIDSALASTLNLPIVDRQPVAGAHGSGEVNRHLAQTYVPGIGLYGLWRVRRRASDSGRAATLRAHRKNIPAELHHGIQGQNRRCHALLSTCLSAGAKPFAWPAGKADRPSAPHALPPCPGSLTRTCSGTPSCRGLDERFGKARRRFGGEASPGGLRAAYVLLHQPGRGPRRRRPVVPGARAAHRRHRRRERLREVGRGALHPGHHPAAGTDRRGQHPLPRRCHHRRQRRRRRHGSCAARPAERGVPVDPRPGDRHDLPGADERAEPRAHGRQPDRRGALPVRRGPHQGDRARPLRGPAGRGRHPLPPAP